MSKEFEQQNETALYIYDIFAQIETERLLEVRCSDDIVMLAEKFFEAHIKEKISIRDAAWASGVSVPSLTLHFNKATGVSPMKYLNNMRLRRAETLLCRTDLSIAEIAQECGFDNAYYFCNVFKKYNNIPPSKFRSMYII